jgi:hypothetical protein
MRAEVEYLERGAPALRWALGCLRAGIAERLCATPLLGVPAIRWGIALWVGYLSASVLCNVALVLSHKAPDLGLAALLTHCVQGDDYRALIPLFEAITPLQLAGWVLVCVAYMAAIALAWRRQAASASLLMGASLLNAILWINALREPLFVQAFASSEMISDGLLLTITLLAAWSCWISSRPRDSLMR